MRKGYWGEYKVKKILEERYGKGNVLKAAIGQGFDYICLDGNMVQAFVEVKCSQGKYYESRHPRDKEQHSRNIKQSKTHRIRYVVFILAKRKIEEKILYEPEIVEE